MRMLVKQILNSLICVLFVCFGFHSINVYGQDPQDVQLANHYYNKGELEKAKPYYEKIYRQNPNHVFFSRYYECLKAEKNNKELEKLIKKQLKISNHQVRYQVLLAQFYEQQQEVEKAQEIYEEMIDNLEANPSSVINTYNALKTEGKSVLAFKTLERGRKLLGDSYPLNYYFAEFYGSENQVEKMVDEYLALLDYNQNYHFSITSNLARKIDFEDKNSKSYLALKSGLFKRAQKYPNKEVYTELITWFFTQSREFSAALFQEKAYDRRIKLGGDRVYKLGLICISNGDFETARKAFEYVKSLGTASPLYNRAENALLNTIYNKIIKTRNVSKAEITNAVADYQDALSRLGKTLRTWPLMLELAHLQAYYNNQPEQAIDLLNEALNLERLTTVQEAETKVKLADVLVLSGDVWQASLYYLQVYDALQFEPIGQEARYKNAKIFYYDGEFKYAQSQLDVLKRGTSNLIANNALKLSLLITENFGLDSNYQAMFWFASADLLIEQHQYKQAFQLFDSIMEKYPAHSLGDDMLLKKAQAMQQQGKWNEALSFLDELLNYYSDDILVDDALFTKGEIYENHLFDKEKAMKSYKDLLYQQKGSLFATEARKRIRKLRGEDIP